MQVFLNPQFTRVQNTRALCAPQDTRVQNTRALRAPQDTRVQNTRALRARKNTFVSKTLVVVEDYRGISTKRKEEIFGKLNKLLLLSTPSMKKGERHENNLHWGHLNNSIMITLIFTDFYVATNVHR